MPSELDTHDILFNPVRKRRAEQAARRTADQPEFSDRDRTPVRSRADKDAPATDRAVAYAIAEADTGPLVSSKLIAGIAIVAAIATAAVLMRTPKLAASAQDEAAADERLWWTAAREQWANENMRVWPIVIRGNRSGAKATATASAPMVAGSNTVSPPTPVANATTAAPAVAAVPNATGAAIPRPASPPARPDNPYADTPRAVPSTPAKASDNPYGNSPAPRASKPGAESTDNPY